MRPRPSCCRRLPACLPAEVVACCWLAGLLGAQVGLLADHYSRKLDVVNRG